MARFTVLDNSFIGYQPPEPPKTSVFDIFTKLLLPIALAVAAIFGRAHPWFLLGFAVLALVASFSRPLHAGVRSLLASLHDRAAARRGLKKLRRFSSPHPFRNSLSLDEQRENTVRCWVEYKRAKLPEEFFPLVTIEHSLNIRAETGQKS